MLERPSASALWESAWSVVNAEGDHRRHARGDYVESLHSVLCLTDPRQRWVLSRRPTLNPAFALAEVIWILRGRNDAAFLNSWNAALPRFAGDVDIYYGAYGERVRSRFDFDQLEQAASALDGSPEQRQVVLQIWDPRTDFPSSDGRSRARDIPCNIVAMLKVVGGRLEWTQVMRSNDLVMGLPYNLVQWTTMQEVLAGWLGLEVGSYFHIADSLHVYDRDRDGFNAKIVAPETHPTATDLRLSKPESDRVFESLESFVDRIRVADDREAISDAMVDIQVAGYADWVSVFVAERLRRIGAVEDVPGVLEGISDPQLRAVARNWHEERRPRA